MSATKKTPTKPAAKAGARPNEKKPKPSKAATAGDAVASVTAESADLPIKAAKKTKAAKPKKVSALDAAARVLAEAGESMTTKAMVEAMAAKQLWTSPGGKTPHATLYSAILREIGTKKAESRFKKTDKGHFAATTRA